MNKTQREILNSRFKTEQEALKNIEAVYKKALKDVTEKMKDFTARIQMDAGDTSAVYQLKYQQQLYKQLSDVLEGFNDKQYKTVSEFIENSYNEGFLGTMYDLHNQGIPLIFPPNHEAIVDAVFIESKISAPLYQALGENVELLKKRIANNVARGIATSSSWQNIALNIKNSTILPMSRVMTIARTEGHRVINKATSDAQHKAKEKGAEIVKQWDAAMDKKTRKGHAEVDGEIRELDEKFSNGLMYPGDPNGTAAQVINCRCALLQRAKWALDAEELETLKKRAEYFGLDKTKNFDEFKKKYMKAVENEAGSDKIDESDVLSKPLKKSADSSYNDILSRLNKSKVDYMPVTSHQKELTTDEIIEAISGGDNTQGSCASLGLAYIGQRQGWNVLDYRDGASREFFSRTLNLAKLSNASGLETLHAKGACNMTVANRLLKKVETGKEYYLCVGQHASIVRKTDEGVLQYLELQSARDSGWTDFDADPKYTLRWRFGCNTRKDWGIAEQYDFMINIDDSDFNTDEFRSALGYINTETEKQRKSNYGTIK